MEFASVVRFSSHPRPFRLDDSYCNNPDCDCQAVILTFTEISDRGEPIPKPLKFQTQIDLPTWQELNPTRSPIVSRWVAEFMSDCGADRREYFKARLAKVKQALRRRSEYRIDPKDIMTGTLVSYVDMESPGGSVSSGGNAYTYEVPHENRTYLVEDRYCPNPQCDCRLIHLSFFEYRAPHDDHEGLLALRLDATVSFAGKTQVRDRYECSLAQANSVLMEWWKAHRDDLPMLKDRYQEVKKIAERSLSMPSSKRSPWLPDTRQSDLLNSTVPPDTLTRAASVGRNDPCPCGSGKKYKNCCLHTQHG